MKLNVENTVKKLKSLTDDGPIVVIMIGPPGSGKSTLVKKCREAMIDLDVASTDDFIDATAAQLGCTYSEAWDKIDWKEANEQFVDQQVRSLKAHNNLIVDRTHMSVKSRKLTFKLAEMHGHKMVALNMCISKPQLLERLDKRAAETGKIIPDQVVNDMLNRFSPPTHKEGFDLIIDVQQ